MMGIVRTIYYALELVFSRKITRLVDEMEVNIPFNHTEEPASSTQFVYNNMVTALINWTLIQLFSRHESSLDPMHTLVTRVQQNDENLFQYISILKKIAREAFEIDTIKKDDFLIDRFIPGLKDNRIKEKLCSQFNLSLREIVEQASIWENTGADITAMSTTVQFSKPQTSTSEEQPRHYICGWKNGKHKRKAVEDFIKQCEVCQKTKNPTTLPKAPLKSIKCHYPMQLVTMDIVGPLAITSNGNKYILVICCHFSKFVVLFSLAEQQAETVANSLLEFILVFGLFTNVLTDQGTNFQSELMKKLYGLLDIYELKTSAYHPQCNGITERFNRTLKTMLSCFSNENQNNWDQLIKKLAFAYNSSVHNATNYTPYELMFGRKPKLLIDLVIRSPEPIVSVDELAENSELSIDQEILVEPPNPDQSLVDIYVCQVKEHLNEVFKHVEQNQDLKLNKGQWLYNRNIKPHTYVEGDLVLKNVVTVKTGLSKKLSQEWEGPYVIVKRIYGQNYQIKQANNHKSKCRVVHHNRLKKFFGNLSQYPVQNVPENVQMSGQTLHKKRGRKKRLVHQKPSVRTENLIPPQEETASEDTTSAPIAEQIHAAQIFFPTQVPQSRNLTDLGARLRKPVVRLTYHR
ncbi:unnamed protein product [Brachionus calyciflorus]|uniref:Integrase catalytic domain-containing protein n=1 Tax=Brachionus calyciflorus TaxID=104777 RepID=A0A814JYX7_9BILA|nr:unnamed protein product [Brachionus calyciflorus]